MTPVVVLVTVSVAGFSELRLQDYHAIVFGYSFKFQLLVSLN